MKSFLRLVNKFCRLMDWIGGTVLVFMMLLTVADVILRYLGRPILGTYELVSLGGLVVVGLAMPHSSWQGVHVNVDIFLDSAHRMRTLVLKIITRIIGVLFFIIAGVNLIDMGNTLTKTHESTLTLTLPLYPFAYVLGICCLAECLVLISQVVKLVTKEAINE
jgi:TRAP-type C4-dicarboxylate transport system permease small subunit